MKKQINEVMVLNTCNKCRWFRIDHFRCSAQSLVPEESFEIPGVSHEIPEDYNINSYKEHSRRKYFKEMNNENERMD